MADEADEDSFRLTRDLGDRGPSLAERLTERLDRLSFASPFHRMRLKGRFPLKLIAVPDDPVPGDPALGQRLKGGRLFRDGSGQGMAEARLDAPEAPESWRDWVHGWGWLRDLSAAPDLSRAEAQRSEALAKRMNKKTVEKPEQSPEVSVDYIAELEKELEGALGRKISIQQGKHSGQLTLEYYGAEDLERLSEALRNLRV